MTDIVRDYARCFSALRERCWSAPAGQAQGWPKGSIVCPTGLSPAMRFSEAAMGPDRVKTQTPGRLFMNFSRFSAFSAITGPAERKNSLQMRRFQTISEFSHSLDDPLATIVSLNGNAGHTPKRPFSFPPQGAPCGPRLNLSLRD